MSIEGNDVSGLGSQSLNESRSLLGKSVDVMGTAVNASENAYHRIANTSGLIRQDAVKVKSSVNDAFVSISRLGGSYNDAMSTLEGYMAASNRTAMLQDKTLTKLFSTAKVGGLELQSLPKNFIEAGFSIEGAGAEMEKAFDVARKTGTLLSTVSQTVASNLKELDTHNFKGGVEGLAKMAATSATLRVNLSQVMQAVDSAMNPEGAIEMAAALQRLGVTQSELLDPTSLMNMSMNSPEDFQQSLADLAESMMEVDAAGNIKVMPGEKLRIQEIAKSVNMSTEEFIKMGKASKELDYKLKMIEFPDFINEEQKTLLTNISEMQNGKMMINVDGQFKDLNETLQGISNKEEFDKLIKSTEKMTSEEILLEQLTYLKRIAGERTSLTFRAPMAVASSKTTETVMGAETDIKTAIMGVFNDAIDVKDLRAGIDENIGGILTQMSKLTSGDGSWEDVLGSFKTAYGNVEKSVENTYNKIIELGSDAETKLLSSGNELTKGIIALIKKAGATQNIDFSPNSNVNPNEATLSSLGSIGANVTETSDNTGINDIISELGGVQTATVNNTKLTQQTTDVLNKLETQLNTSNDTETIKKLVNEGLIKQQNGNYTVDVNVNLLPNQQLDQNTLKQFEQALKTDTGLKEAVTKAVKEINSNFGLQNK